MQSFSKPWLAPTAVCVLIVTLSYGSQLLFRFMEPYSLEREQALTFNALVLALWISYYRACTTDPGSVPPAWKTEDTKAPSGRYCNKCEARKPPRAHHCKICRRCIPKMDHHCPWTANCVCHRTFPHFMRFLFYAVLAMGHLEYFLYLRAVVVWNDRDMPSYLGPSASQLVPLLGLILINSLTLFAVGVIFLTSAWALCFNTTTIEGWEIDRHEALVLRARRHGGYLAAPDGARVRIKRQEYPYDVGIWRNISQGMGGGLLSWLWPLAASPSAASGLEFEVNGFEGYIISGPPSSKADKHLPDASLTWPPPDPERMAWPARKFAVDDAFTKSVDLESDKERIRAFKRRQEIDLNRRRDNQYRVHVEDQDDGSSENFPGLKRTAHAWRGSEGERLDDFGVDEDADFYDDPPPSA